MTEPRYRLLVICSHPVQYMSPLLRRMAEHPQLELSVAYCTLCGAEAAHDPEFGATVKWDIPLLDGYKWIHIPNRGSGDESFFGLYNPGLWKFIREGAFAAVFCFTGYHRASFWVSFVASKLSRAAFLFGTDATTLVPMDGREWKKPVKRVVWPLLYRLATHVLAPSAATVELMKSLGIPSERITLTPFVVDNDWWKAQVPQTDRAAMRSSWRVGPSQLAVLFCAKLQPWKRPQDLLRAFALAAPPDSILVFAGEGPLRQHLQDEASSLGIANRVRFLGFVNQTQLPAVYTAADLFVLPSSYDACPVVVCEAMLCGLPVLLSDEIRGRFDLVIPGRTGEIFPCGNVEALAAALRKLLSDRAVLATLSLNARERMETWSPRENIAAGVDAVRRAVERLHRF